MRIGGLLVLLLGLLFAVGHPLYALHFSGEQVARLAMQDGASWSASGVPRTGAGALRAVELRLDPSMSPVRFIVAASVSGQLNATSRFDATLSRADGSVAWRGPVVFLAAHDGSTQDSAIVVHTLDVDRGSDWRFALLPTAQRSANVNAVTLEVRRNVGGISTSAIGIGAALSLWGALMLAHGQRTARERQRRRGWNDVSLPDHA